MPSTIDATPLARGSMTNTKRIELLETDREAQSRVLTELITKVGQGFSPEQLAQIRAAMREELADAGLRLDGAAHQDEAREDFRFIRRLRKRVDGAASKVGATVILAIASGAIWLVMQGLNLWKGQ